VPAAEGAAAELPKRGTERALRVSVLVTLFLGLLMGFLGSLPTAGPVGMLVVSRALMGRPRSGLHVALGSAVAEATYALVAFWGFAVVLARFPQLVAASRLLACVLFAAMGLYLVVRGIAPRAPGAPPDHGGQKSALLGFTMTALNPTLLLTWGSAAGVAHATGLPPVGQLAAIPFAIGVGCGSLGWFAILLWLLARVRVAPPTLALVIRWMGAALLVAGVALGVRLTLS
jgi:threonine/homoserine/homoserine lactone efflux protein